MTGYGYESPAAGEGNAGAHGAFRRAALRLPGIVRFLAGVTFVVVSAMPEGLRMPGWLLLVGLVALLVLLKPPWLWRWRLPAPTARVVEGDKARAWLVGSGLALVGAAVAAALDSTRTDMGVIGAAVFGMLVGFGVRTAGPSLRVATRTEIALTVTALGILAWQYVKMRQDLDSTGLPLIPGHRELIRLMHWYMGEGGWFAEAVLWLLALGFASATARPSVERPVHAEHGHRSRQGWTGVLAVIVGVSALVAVMRWPVPLPAQQAALRQLDTDGTRALTAQMRADTVGDCVRLPLAQAVPSSSSAKLTDMLDGSFGLVPCSNPHDFEVFYTFPIATDAYLGAPGNPEDQECDAHLAGYVGAGNADITYYDYATPPVPSQWAAGDHRATCYLFRADRRSMVGTARTR